MKEGGGFAEHKAGGEERRYWGDPRPDLLLMAVLPQVLILMEKLP